MYGFTKRGYSLVRKLFKKSLLFDKMLVYGFTERGYYLEGKLFRKRFAL